MRCAIDGRGEGDVERGGVEPCPLAQEDVEERARREGIREWEHWIAIVSRASRRVPRRTGPLDHVLAVRIPNSGRRRRDHNQRGRELQQREVEQCEGHEHSGASGVWRRQEINRSVSRQNSLARWRALDHVASIISGCIPAVLHGLLARRASQSHPRHRAIVWLAFRAQGDLVRPHRRRHIVRRRVRAISRTRWS